MEPSVTFELKVRKQNQPGVWNISIRPTFGASFIKTGRPTFLTSGTLSQTMTLKLKSKQLLNFRNTLFTKQNGFNNKPNLSLGALSPHGINERLSIH